MARKVGERAQNRWKEILPRLDIASTALTNKHGPCPVCGGKDRFRFDDKDGKGTWFCSQQHGGDSDNGNGSAGNGFALIMDKRRCDFAEAARLVETIIGTDSEPQAAPVGKDRQQAGETYAAVKLLWREGQPLHPDNAAGRYLITRLGVAVQSRALRYHPAIPRGERTFPGLLSAYVDLHGDLAGLQRTYLTPEGRKISWGEARLTMGTLPPGGAVRLAPQGTGHVLGIAEGVETALSAAAMHGIPCWAALNEGRLQLWEPPPPITDVVIFGDNDTKKVGQAAAYALAKRLETRPTNKIITQVMIPPDVGTDWNDVHQQSKTRR